jgi:hypothetical protein
MEDLYHPQHILHRNIATPFGDEAIKFISINVFVASTSAITDLTDR